MNFRQIFSISIRYAFGSGNGYLSPFLSMLSTLALILAVCLLITVLSVMNGFDKEMRERILWFIPHVTVNQLAEDVDLLLRAKVILRNPDVIEVEYFKKIDSLIFHERKVETVSILAFNFNDSQDNPRITKFLSANDLLKIRNSKDGLVVGMALAEKLGVSVGDRLTLIIPKSATEFHKSISMRLKIEAILATGTQIDEVLAILPMEIVSARVPKNAITSGFFVYVKDIFDAPMVAWELEKTLGYSPFFINTWFDTHGNLYSAIQLSRDLIGILLFSVITVAAFNVVASLVLMVMDKRAGIAILRTLGTSSLEIAWIFIMIGVLIGGVGVVFGSIAGIILSKILPRLIELVEEAAGISFLNTDVYPINFVPVDIAVRDIAVVGCITLLMCVLATIYPAISASRVHPASALKSNAA